MSKFLIDDQPLIVLPKLASAIGLNEAIVIQQIHYWLKRSNKIHDGRAWTFNTLEKWNEQFPFWSHSTLKRTVSNLRKPELELLIATDKYNQMKIDKTLWYSIDYEKLNALEQASSQSEADVYLNVSKLLIDDQPLLVLPKLACVLGLNEAIIIQQVHYWLKKSDKTYDGRLWTFNTLEQWNEQFPFWSLSTLKRTISNLRKPELLIATDKYNQMKIDKTLWYSIDYEKLMTLEKEYLGVTLPSGQNELMGDTNDFENDLPSGQNELMGDTNEKSMTFPSGQNDPSSGSKWSVESVNMNQALPETSTKTSTDSKDKKKSSKRGKRVFNDSDIEMKLVNHFMSLILQDDPKFKKPNIQTWCDYIRLLIEKDERTPEEIKSVMEWANADSFWKSNILSTKKLRDKFSQLKIQMNQPARTGYGKNGGSNMQKPKWLDAEKEKQRLYEESRKSEFEADIPDDEEMERIMKELKGETGHSEEQKNAHY